MLKVFPGEVFPRLGEWQGKGVRDVSTCGACTSIRLTHTHTWQSAHTTQRIMSNKTANALENNPHCPHTASRYTYDSNMMHRNSHQNISYCSPPPTTKQERELPRGCKLTVSLQRSRDTGPPTYLCSTSGELSRVFRSF